jgi:hypothetical protein
MSPHDTVTPGATLSTTWFALLRAYRSAVCQERLFVRLIHLSVASVVCLGRHTLSQLLVTLGLGAADWTAWYRVFNRARVDIDTVQTTLLT